MRVPKTRRGRSRPGCELWWGVGKQGDAERLRSARRALVEDQVAVLITLI